jgi:hypothetical protein
VAVYRRLPLQAVITPFSAKKDTLPVRSGTSSTLPVSNWPLTIKYASRLVDTSRSPVSFTLAQLHKSKAISERQNGLV